MAPRWTKKQLNGFHDAAQSLKLYRRADMQSEEGISLIEGLYVDPLPYDHILQTTLKNHTTFLIGRKGTGKSTIFERAQHDLRKKPNYTYAYIDIKTLFESSQADPDLMKQAASASGVLSKKSLEKLLLYKAFLQSIISQITEQLKKRIKDSTIWERIKAIFSDSVDELFGELDALMKDISKSQFISIMGLKTATIHSTNSLSSETDVEGTADASLGSTPALKASLATKDSEKTSTEQEQTFSDVLMRVFDVKNFLLRLKALLNKIKIKHLYIFVDDFSELPQDAMMIVVDTLLAPLNNWSEELIKFKVAAYPNMVYYGAIDKTKIDEINLDLYQLYGNPDPTTMERKAIEFTKRLVQTRLRHYCGCDAEVFLETKNEEIWRVLFYATMTNPRNLGYILFYLYESNLIYDMPISISSVRGAAHKYYEEKIEAYFRMNQFLQVSFEEHSSVMSLKELLDAIVERARELRRYKSSQVMSGIAGRAPTSHFHILSEFEALLSTLELNFFLTKYYERKDRSGKKVSVFALNYGLCQKHQIIFGAPIGTPYLHYFTERIFNYTAILQHYLEANQEIKCDKCGNVFDSSDLPALKMYQMKCPKCFVGTCQVINLSQKYESMLESVNKALQLPQIELSILQALRDNQPKPMLAGDIGKYLDCSSQLIGKRGRNLIELGLIKKTDKRSRSQFELTALAEELYFSTSETGNFDIDFQEAE